MTDEPSAPRPVPETAAGWGLACRDCSYEQRVDSLALANECRDVHETVRPEHNVWITAPAPPAEPVEAQRCRTCGHGETAHVENEGEWGYCNDCGPEFTGVHEFDAEDEGARPLEVKRSGRSGNNQGWFWQIEGVRVGRVYVHDAIEAAIRKEATAAQVELEEAAYRHAEHWQRLYNEVFDQATVERTRAEAAEGALAQLETDLANEIHDVQMIAGFASEVYMEVTGGRISKPTTLPFEVLREHENECERKATRDADEAREEAISDAAWAFAYRARALTAESVTPTGEPQ